MQPEKLAQTMRLVRIKKKQPECQSPNIKHRKPLMPQNRPQKPALRKPARRPQDRPHSSGPPLKAAGNRLFIWGWHAVNAALANPNRQITRIVIGRADRPQLAEFLSSLPSERQAALPAPQKVDAGHLDRLAGPDSKAVHQQIALEVAPLDSPDLSEVLFGAENLRLLVLDQVTDPRNIGAIMRSAAAFRADALVMTARHAPEESGLLAKAAAGALESVPIVRVVNLARALDQMKEAGVLLAGLEAGGTTRLDTLAGTARLGLVLGAEGSGMRRLTREACDHLAAIAMPGQAESLNVSVAAGIALFATCPDGSAG